MRVHHWLRHAAIAIVAAIALGVGAQAHAQTFSFEGISNNDPFDTEIVENQMFVTVSAADPGEVLFTFENTGPEQSSIARVYFEDNLDLLTGIVDLSGSAGVSFSEGGAPPNLPAGNEVGFDSDYRATADAPPPQNGVNPGEELDVTMSLNTDVTADDVVSAIETFDLRIGIHVIDFESGGSESAIVIPEPASFAALGLGGLAMLGYRRRSRR